MDRRTNNNRTSNFFCESLEERKLLSAPPQFHFMPLLPPENAVLRASPVRRVAAAATPSLLGDWNVTFPYGSDTSTPVDFTVTSVRTKSGHFDAVVSSGSDTTNVNGQLGRKGHFTFSFAAGGTFVSGNGVLTGDTFRGTYYYAGHGGKGSGTYTAKRGKAPAPKVPVEGALSATWAPGSGRHENVRKGDLITDTLVLSNSVPGSVLRFRISSDSQDYGTFYKASATSGTLKGGQTTMITVSYDTSNLREGEQYMAQLNVTIDDNPRWEKSFYSDIHAKAFPWIGGSWIGSLDSNVGGDTINNKLWFEFDQPVDHSIVSNTFTVTDVYYKVTYHGVIDLDGNMYWSTSQPLDPNDSTGFWGRLSADGFMIKGHVLDQLLGKPTHGTFTLGR